MNVLGYTISDKIGSGSYGLVRKCNKDGVCYAVKVMDTEIDKGVTDLLELSIMSSFEHPNINRAINIHLTDQHVYIFQDIADEDLRSYIRKDKVKDKKKLLFDIVNGLYFLHSNGIIHGDVKPSNMLCYGDTVKLTDFGECAKKWYKGMCYVHGTGTPAYKSPEILEGDKWSYQADIWSLGCIFYEVYTKKKLFNNQTNLYCYLYKLAHKDFDMFMNNYKHEMYSYGDYTAPNIDKKFIKSRGENFVKLFKSMMKINKKDRISCDKIISHPYFYKFTFTITKTPKFVYSYVNPIEIIPYIPKLKDSNKITKCLLIRTVKLYSYCKDLNIDKEKKIMACYIICYKLIKGDVTLPSTLILDYDIEMTICNYIGFKLLCL